MSHLARTCRVSQRPNCWKRNARLCLTIKTNKQTNKNMQEPRAQNWNRITTIDLCLRVPA